jgi:hypothetical protein
MQHLLGLRPTGQITKELCKNLELLSGGQFPEQTVQFQQYPGKVLYQGQSDPARRKAATKHA